MNPISICLLAHNNGDYIKNAIESVIAQTHTAWELLICDDASTDKTTEIVSGYLKDPRIAFYRNETNQGQAGNWAWALTKTTHPHITTLHADDAWEKDMLQTLVAIICTQPHIDLICTNWKCYNASLDEVIGLGRNTQHHTYRGAAVLDWVVEKNPTLPSATLFSRYSLELAGPPDLAFNIITDREFFLRIAAVARNAQALDLLLLRYCIHAQSIGKKTAKTDRRISQIINISRKTLPNGTNPPIGKAIYKKLKKQTSHYLMSDSADHLLDGDVRSFFRRFLVASRLDLFAFEFFPRLLGRKIKKRIHT